MISAIKNVNNIPKITEQVATTITNYFQSGTFPEALKIANVEPIFKEGAKTDVVNYWSVSL